MHISRKLQYRVLERNIRYSYIDGMAFSFFLGATVPTYLGLIILRFNGQVWLVNLITAIQPLIMATVCLAAASYANRFERKKTVLIPPSFILRTMILVMAFIPLLPAAWRSWSFLFLWGALFIPWGFCSVSWSPMICNIIPDELRGRFFGTRNALTGVTTLVGTLFAGMIFARLPFNQAFAALFVASFVFTMISQYYLAKHVEPMVRTPAEHRAASPAPSCGGVSMRENFKVFRHPRYGTIFALCCMALFVFHIGYAMAIPLFVVRLVKQLGFDNTIIALITTCQSVAALAGSFVGGRALDRWGYRYVFLFSTLVSVLPPLVWAFANQLPWLMAAAMLAGFTGNAYMLCFSFMVLAVSPDADRSRFVAMNSATGNLAGAIGPLLGILLVNWSFCGIQGALIGAAIIMLVGSALSYRILHRASF